MASLAFLVTGGAHPPAHAANRPPNIVVVLVDDLRWDDLGVAGHPFVETPAIDSSFCSRMAPPRSSRSCGAS